MPKAATEVMEAILYAAVVDAIAALKAASKGVPNALLREIQSVHANTAFSDLPKELQASIAASVRSALTRLLKEGYSVSPTHGPPPRVQPVRRDRPGERSGPRGGYPPRNGRGPGRGPRPGGGPRGKPGGRPGGKPSG